MPHTADIIIIGGGSTGTSTAWQLARRKAGKVLLLDKRGIATGATGKSSGIVRTHYLHETLARMALAALHFFEHFEEIVGGDAGFRRVGFLVPVGEGDEAALQANVAMNQRVGIDSHALDQAQGRELEPRMCWDDLAGAAWEPRSGFADPAAAATAYAAAARREGAEIRIGPQVRRILTRNGNVAGVETDQGSIAAGTVLVAAGFRSAGLLGALGVELPLTPVLHDIVIIRRSPDFGPPHPVVSDRLLGAYHMPAERDVSMLGTNGPGSDIDPEVEADRRPLPEHVDWLVERHLMRFPGEAEATVIGGYTGPYDVSPDVMPILGPVPGIAGLHVAAGFSGHGFKLSPIVGQMLAERIMNGKGTQGTPDSPDASPFDLDLFRLSRYAEGQPITLPHPYGMRSLG